MSEYTNEAEKAARRLHQARGDNHRFTLDALWEHLEKDIPSTSRPPLGNALIKRGVLRLTGNMASSVTAARAGSPAREYTFGPALVEPVAGLPLPKPFLLLAGISGTGKTRFVLQQARTPEHIALVPVRPDWHEPSELLGYLTRLNGERFVATDLLRLMARAWRQATLGGNAEERVLKPVERMQTYWLLLDEMNLAPVEQYFADFLSAMETRDWDESGYRSEPILRLEGLREEVLADLAAQLGFEDNTLWDYFVAQGGMDLPPNLVVAGTVNMDETTHGFSRKVIDRAFTLDFGDFFPADFDHYFEPRHRPVQLGFSRHHKVTRADLAGTADPEGASCIDFCKAVNSVLANTPFELAWRALNELLVAVACFRPEDEAGLRAVQDDWLMTKVLPRLEGDAQKLDLGPEDSLLTRLRDRVLELLGDGERPDLLRVGADPISMRSPRALDRMQRRLLSHDYSSFWP